MAHYETKFKDLYLYHDKYATKYINNFELYVQKLEILEGLWT